MAQVASVALLAPIPLEHLTDSVEVCTREGKVAFGSRRGRPSASSRTWLAVSCPGSLSRPRAERPKSWRRSPRVRLSARRLCDCEEDPWIVS